MTDPSSSPDARAVVRALDALTTQVKRITEEHVRRLTEARPTPVAVAFDAPTTADDGPRCVCGDPLKWYTAPGGGAGWVHDPAPGRPILDVHKPRPTDVQAPAADEDAQTVSPLSILGVGVQGEDAQRDARRTVLRLLLARADRNALATDEGALLRQHVETEIREADTARVVAAGNKRHVQLIVPELEQLRGHLRYVLDYRGPGHAHLAEGRWDRDGSPCAHCARLVAARAALDGTEQPTT